MKLEQRRLIFLCLWVIVAFLLTSAIIPLTEFASTVKYGISLNFIEFLRPFGFSSYNNPLVYVTLILSLLLGWLILRSRKFARIMMFILPITVVGYSALSNVFILSYGCDDLCNLFYYPSTIFYFFAIALVPIVWISIKTKSTSLQNPHMFKTFILLFISIFVVTILSFPLLLLSSLESLVEQTYQYWPKPINEVKQMKDTFSYIDPTYLPEGSKTIRQVIISNGGIYTEYTCQGGLQQSGYTFSIDQNHISSPDQSLSELEEKLNANSDYYKGSEKILINNNPGYLIRESDLAIIELTWIYKDNMVTISAYNACFASEDEYIKIAESMKPKEKN